MANKEGMVIKACPMNGGDDAYSYSQNSAYQRGVAETGNEVMKEAIREELESNSLLLLQLQLTTIQATGAPDPTPPLTTFRIADFGCSVGPTTFISVQNIIEAVHVMSGPDPNINNNIEFQVFFNDQTNNDFNALFRSLPNDQNYFAAGVPGCFYGRLFPKGSLHFGHISSSLHWLSSVPAGALHRHHHHQESEAGRRRRSSKVIMSTGLDDDDDDHVVVNAAYSGQFERDMEAFFHARADELVSGGLLQISALCLPDGVCLSQTGMGKVLDLFRDSLLDLTHLGLIPEEKMETFYVPIYYPQISELEASIKKTRRFSIQKMEKISAGTQAKTSERMQSAVPTLRAVLEGLIKQHFEPTSQAMDSIFQHFADKIMQNTSTIMDPAALEHVEVFILAKRLS